MDADQPIQKATTPPQSNTPKTTVCQTPGRPSSSQPIGSHSRTANDLRGLIKDGLFNAIFESRLMIKTLFPLTEGTQHVINNTVALASQRLRASFQNLRNASEGPENRVYSHFTDFLNEIFSCIKASASSRCKRAIEAVNIAKTQLAKDDDGRAGLKPDMALIPEGRGTEGLSWADIIVGIEVKNQWSKLLYQSHAYGRALLDARPRWFSLIIGYNHQQRTVRFIVYTRMGVYVSPALSIDPSNARAADGDDSTDFELIIWVLSSLMLCRDDVIGLQQHYQKKGDKEYLYLPDPDSGKKGWYQVDQRLTHRKSILGRATRVVSVKPLISAKREREDDDTSSCKVSRIATEEDRSDGTDETTNPLSNDVGDPAPRSQGPAEEGRSDGTGETTGLLSNDVGEPSPGSQDPTEGYHSADDWHMRGSLNHTSSTTDEHAWSCIEDLPPLPESPKIDPNSKSIVVKDSYPLKERAGGEYALWHDLKDQHGIIVAYCCIYSDHGMKLLVELRDIHTSLDFRNMYSPDVVLESEPRVHDRLVLLTQGSSFGKVINDPHRCARAALDVMIGMGALILTPTLYLTALISSHDNVCQWLATPGYLLWQYHDCRRGDCTQ